MVDMQNEPSIAIWENCDHNIAEAIEQFKNRWQPYSTYSRRYPIVRLIHEMIDPAITIYTATLPKDYTAHIPGAETGIGFSQIIKLVGLEQMLNTQRLLLRQFIGTKSKQSLDDQHFIATIESLIGLVWDCLCKRPQTSTSTKGINLNIQRKHGFCDFCGNQTELTIFIEAVADSQINDIELEEHKKLELSHRYCSGHRPKLHNGEWNPAYRQAKRSKTQFHIELSRLQYQCAHRALPRAKSGEKLIDSYFYHFLLGQTLQPADKAELRNLARRMVDSKLSDNKKKMLILQKNGFTQSDIAQKLLNNAQQPMTRQAISKALASVRKEFLL
jgi:hypothetical protein